MMLLAVALGAAVSPNADFARCVQAMRRSPVFAVHAEYTSKTAKGTNVAEATLVVRSPSWASLDVTTPQEGGHGQINWRYEAHGSQVRGYDVNRRIYVLRSYGGTLSAIPTLAATLGPLVPDPIATTMTPAATQKFLSLFSKLKGWSHAISGDTSVWKQSSKKGAVTFGFDRSDGRLSEWSIAGSGATISWKLNYPKVSTEQPLSIPADAYRVEAFRMPPVRPSYKDPATQALVSSCIDTYEHLFKVGVTIVQSGNTTRVWRSGATVVQVGPNGGWRWSNGTLTVWPKGRGVFRGRVQPSTVRSYLAQLKVPMQPIAVAFARDDNYAATIFTPDYAAKLVGDVELHGVNEHMVQLFGPAVKVDLGIDDKGFIRSIDSTAFDAKGRQLAESIRQMSYNDGIGMATAPAGRAKPMPKLLPPPKLPKGFKFPDQ